MRFFPKLNYKTLLRPRAVDGQAFTLVELLVVIVIIGILGSVITASLGSARKQARDAKRVADVKNIAQALEQYYTDKGGYPVISSGSENTDAGLCIESSTTLQGMLIPGYLASVPVDPLYNAANCTSDLNAGCHCYIYRTQGSSAKTKEFKLFSKTEAQVATQQGAVSEGGLYYFEAASPTETAAAMAPSPGSQYGNWFGALSGPTFTRTSVAYKNDGTAVAPGVPRFETIASGLQGLTIEEGTTNVVANSSFEADSDADGLADSWLKNQGTPVMSIITGAYSPRAQRVDIPAGTTSTPGMYQQNIAVTASATYNISFVYRTNIVNRYWTMRVYNEFDATWPVIETLPTSNGTWSTYSKSFVAPSNATTVRLYFMCTSGYTAEESIIDIDNVQIEHKPYETSYTASTRSAESLSAPTAGVISTSQGTIEMLVNVSPATIDQSTQHSLFRTQVDATHNRILLIHSSGSNTWLFKMMDSAGATTQITAPDTSSSSGLHRFAARWTSTDLSLFIDGTKYSIASPNLPSAFSSAITLGAYEDGSTQLDGQISDVIFSNRARTDAELQARGVLTAIPVDSSTTYKLGLNGSLN